MSLKYKIIEMLQDMDDEQDLQKVLDFIQVLQAKDEVDKLPSHTKSSLADSIRNLSEGSVADYTAMEKIINEWLK